MEGQATDMPTHESHPADEPDPKRARLETPEPKPTIILDEYGDLRLCVGADHAKEPSTYLVCSRTLARSSLVMKKMLFGSFAESRPRDGGQDDWVVQLPDDEPAPMQLMLNIIHGHFANVPSAIGLDALYALVILLDKYDAVSLTRPWVRAWLQNVSSLAANTGTRLLSIAWALGDLQLFSTVQSNLLEICRVDNNGHLIVNGCVLSENTAPLIPPLVIEHMTKSRAQWISTKLNPYLTIYNVLTKGKWKCKPNPAQPDTSKSSSSPYSYYNASTHSSKPPPTPTPSLPSHCKAVALGSLVQGFLDMGINITGNDPANSYRGTITDLKWSVNAFKLLVLPTCQLHDHDECKAMQASEAKKNEWMLIPLNTIRNECRALLETQAKKTGL